jgi:hypothetical protein
LPKQIPEYVADEFFILRVPWKHIHVRCIARTACKYLSDARYKATELIDIVLSRFLSKQNIDNNIANFFVGVGCVRRHLLYYSTPNTFITSSPRWLITFTAMRPVDGLSNGREVSLLRVDQASSSISAFSVVLSAL